jgi:hypothetical protein
MGRSHQPPGVQAGLIAIPESTGEAATVDVHFRCWESDLDRLAQTRTRQRIGHWWVAAAVAGRACSAVQVNEPVSAGDRAGRRKGREGDDLAMTRCVAHNSRTNAGQWGRMGADHIG